MATPSYHDPATWLDLGRIDPVLDQLMKKNIKPQLTKAPDIANIARTRELWNPKFEAIAEAALLGTNGTVNSENVAIPRRDGGSSRALLYRPREEVEQIDAIGRPLIVMIHGGGFVYGTPEMEAPNAIGAVQAHGCIAICLSYRLAPEHKFPAATDDCWDALQWIVFNASKLGGDLSKGFLLGGTSAGGNIAIVLSHMARDEKLPSPLTGMWLNVPLVLAPEAVYPQYKPLYQSREQNACAPILNKAFMDMYTEAYQPSDLQNSHIWSPINWPGGHGKAHAGMPPTYFQICGLDVLRDEGLIYERVLRTEYGVRTLVDIYPGLPHMFVPNFPEHPSSLKYPQDTINGIGWLFRGGK